MSSKTIYSFVRIALVLSFPPLLQAQEQLPIIIPPSPTSVQFQRYGEHPVGHFTGVPDITIPIFTIQEGDITVPITMSYHASGFRAHEPDGHTGMGWTLNTGGMLTREIRGLPDDLAQMDVPDATYGILWPGHFGTLGISDYEYLKYLHTKGGSYGSTVIDHEIDLYTYSFLGKSGRYIIDPNNNFEHFFIDQNNLILDSNEGFQDENGIIYYFGGATGIETQWFEYMRPNSGSPSYFETSTTFHMSTILSTRYPGRGVSYQYQPGKVFPNGGSTQTDVWQATWDYYWHCGGGCNPDVLPYTGDDINNLNRMRNLNLDVFYPRAYYTTKFPGRITHSSGELTFHLSSQQLLQRIDIWNIHGELLRQVTFEYGTFDISERSGSSVYPRPRSSLQAIVFRDVNGDEVERYTFGYYGSGSYLVGGTDHWGFANLDPVGGLIPWNEYITSYYLDRNGNYTGLVNLSCTHPTLRYLGGNANKEASEAIGHLFALERITYPTGGHTQFTYEGHRNQFGGAVTGGIRIKKIDTFTASNVWIGNKEYIYEGAYQEVIPSNDMYRRDHFVEWCGGGAMRLSINQHPGINTSPMGSSIVYGQVIEKEGDRQTRYNYAINQAYEYRLLTSPVGTTYYDRTFTDSYRPWSYGYLTAKTVLRNGVVEFAEYYDYETFETGQTRDLLVDRARSVVEGGSIYSPTESEYNLAHIWGVEFFNYANRYHVSGGKRLKSKWLIKDGTQAVTYYDYTNPDYLLQATRSRTRTSEGDEIWTDMKYSFDETVAPYPAMLSQNRMDVIEETSYRYPGNVFMNNRRTDWRDWGSGVIAPELVKYKLGDPNGPYQNNVRYYGYDPNGNPESVSLEHGPRESYLWAYNRVHPVIRGVNVTESELRTACGLALGVLGYTVDWDDSADVFLTSLGSVTSIVSRSRLQSFVTALRSHLPVQGQVEVYTYDPGFGMSSATDARGVTVYYGYDGFLRPQRISDFENNILKDYRYNLR